MIASLNHQAQRQLPYWIAISCCLVFISCSIQVKIPSVVDDRVEALVRTEAARILAVSEDRDHASQYQFFLSSFPRQDLFGMSLGDRRIYISYQLASWALRSSNQLWLLRQTVAHEIGHETAGHAKRERIKWFNAGVFNLGTSGSGVGLPWYVRLYNYSTEKELEADLKGLEYWNKLGWDCRIWVGILKGFQEHNYTGDEYHPTDRRLLQAENACKLQRAQKEVHSTESELQTHLN